MALIDQITVQAHLSAGANASTTSGKGRAFEDLICYLFGLVPGISITHRNVLNAFDSEEIDVALWNEAHSQGFPFLSNIILVECKNWSSAVGSLHVNWFDSKIRNRGLDFGILVAANGITGDASDLTAAHAVVAAALRERRKLVVLTALEIQALADTTQLVESIKKKLCALAVSGTIA